MPARSKPPTRESSEHRRERGRWLIPGPLLRLSVHTIRHCLAVTHLNPHHPAETVLTCGIPVPGVGSTGPAPWSVTTDAPETRSRTASDPGPTTGRSHPSPTLKISGCSTGVCGQSARRAYLTGTPGPRGIPRVYQRAETKRRAAQARPYRRPRTALESLFAARLVRGPGRRARRRAGCGRTPRVGALLDGPGAQQVAQPPLLDAAQVDGLGSSDSGWCTRALAERAQVQKVMRCRCTGRAASLMALFENGSVRSSVNPQVSEVSEGSFRQSMSRHGEQDGRGCAVSRDRCASGARQRLLRRPGGGGGVHRSPWPMPGLPETGEAHAQLVSRRPV